MIKKISLLLLCALFMPAALRAESPTAQFLLIGQGARASALGYAVAANCFDHTAMYWNPAATVFMQDPSLGAGMTQLPADISAGCISFSGPTSIKRKRGFGINLITETADVPEYDIYGTKLSNSLSVNNSAVQTAIAFKIGEYFSLAPTLGFVSMKLGKYSSSTAPNFGLSTLYMKKRFSAGFVVANMGGKLEFMDSDSKAMGPGQPQPQLTRFGLSYSLLKNKNLILLYGLQSVSNDNTASWNGMGIEYLLTKYFAFRAGTRTINGAYTIPSFGLGLNYKRLSIEFASMNAASDLEGTETSRIDFQFRFKNTDPALAKPKKDEKKEFPEPSQKPKQAAVPITSIGISTIAVAEFSGKNVSQADASIVSDFLRTELVNTGAFILVEKANMDKLLAESAFQQSGCSAADCAVKMGKILNVKYMLVGSLSKLLDVYYITVNLVSVETGEIVRSYNQEAATARELKEGCRTLSIRIADER